MSLIEFLKSLLTDAGLREDFATDPQGTLHAHGLDTVTPEDVHDALVLSGDDQTGDFSRHYDTGHNTINVAPPPPVHHDYASPAQAHQAAAEYLSNYVTNNYIDDRDTTIDSSVNQQIDTHGGNFDQDIDEHPTTASGDGAVAVGGDADHSPITTGNGNQVGEGNVHGNGNVVGHDNQAVTGNGNTTAFGSGAANSTTAGHDITVGDGSGFGTGSAVTVDNSDNSLHDVGNDHSDHSLHNVGNDNSDHSLHDVGNVHEPIHEPVHPDHIVAEEPDHHAAEDVAPHHMLADVAS